MKALEDYAAAGLFCGWCAALFTLKAWLFRITRTDERIAAGYKEK